VIHFSFPLFAGYLRDGVVAHRALLRNCLRQVLPKPMLEVAGFPSFGRATITAKGPQRLLHLLSYVPEKRGKSEMIEEPIVVSDVQVTLRKDGSDVSKVLLAPQDEPLPFTQTDDEVRFVVPRVSGYQLVVVE
jgi:hypothetical protein